MVVIAAPSGAQVCNSAPFDGAGDNQTDSYGYYYTITGGKFPTGLIPNGDNASGGTFRFILDEPAWGYPVQVWNQDDWFPQNAGLALTLLNDGAVAYDNNGLEDNSFGTFYNNLGGGPDAAKPGLYRAYSMSNNWDFIYATYFKLDAPTTIDTLIGYLDANGGAADPFPFDPVSPFIRYRMNIWSSLFLGGAKYVPVNTNSFTGDVFSTDCVPSTGVASDTGIQRVFQNGSQDPIWRVTMSLAQPVTLPAGVYFFSHDASIVMPRTRKLDVVASLTAANGTGRQTTHRFDKALDAVQASLAAAYWQDDDSLTDDGHKVFREENKALDELRHVVTDQRATAADQGTAAAVVAELTAADAALALRAIEDAKAAAVLCGPSNDCPKTVAEIGRAERAYEQGRTLGAAEGWKAVDRFREAWEHAMKALGHVPAP
jgi:hypothetical protein